jgi:hypothetical protein
MRRALAGAAKGSGKIGPLAAGEAMTALVGAVEAAARRALSDAAEAGSRQAERTLAVYGLRPQGAARPDIEGGVRAVRLAVERQREALLTLALNGQADEALALGDGSRVGLVAPGAATARQVTGSRMLLAACSGLRAGNGWQQNNSTSRPSRRWTSATDCCLQVNGQAVALERFPPDRDAAV